MTVADLIEELKQFDPALPVVKEVHVGDDNRCYSIDTAFQSDHVHVEGDAQAGQDIYRKAVVL